MNAAQGTYQHADVSRDLLMRVIGNRRNVNGSGLRRSVGDRREVEWSIVVNLRKEPRWWHRKIPTSWNGIEVETQVIGEVYAL